MSPSLLCAVIVKHELVCPSRLSIKYHPNAGTAIVDTCRCQLQESAWWRIGHLLRVLPELGINVVLDSQVADVFHFHLQRESTSYYGSRTQSSETLSLCSRLSAETWLRLVDPARWGSLRLALR